jgi:hypothetical protein
MVAACVYGSGMCVWQRHVCMAAHVCMVAARSRVCIILRDIPACSVVCSRALHQADDSERLPRAARRATHLPLSCTRYVSAQVLVSRHT